MRDSVAIVTGGGTGIGAVVVRRLAARGARCVVNYASSRDAAEAVAGEVGGGSIAVQADNAGPIVMLLDPESRVMTGETMLLDAGAHLDTGLSRRPGREG